MTDHRVRVATPDDETEVMDLCHALHEENGLFSMDDDRVRGTLRMAFDKKGGLLGVIGDPGQIEAMIYMLFAQFWYSTDWHLEELFSYCRPEYRKSNNARHLIDFAKKCSDEIGLPLMIGIVSNTRTEAKIELYKRQLKKPVGSFFLYGMAPYCEAKKAV